MALLMIRILGANRLIKNNGLGLRDLSACFLVIIVIFQIQ